MIRWGYPVKDARKAPTGMLIFRSVFLWCIMGRIKDLLVWRMWAGGVTVLGAGGKSDGRGGSEGTGGEKAMSQGGVLAFFVFLGKCN